MLERSAQKWTQEYEINLDSGSQIQLEKENQYILVRTLTMLNTCIQALITPTSFEKPSCFNPHTFLFQDIRLSTKE